MQDELLFLSEVLGPGVERLLELGIEPDFSIDPPVNPDQLDAFNKEFGLELPEDVRRLYSETDGFMISWETGDAWGHLDFPTLYELRLFRQRWKNGDMPDETWTEHLSEKESAEILEQMKFWLPFDDSGSGNLMCIDSVSGRVVEYDHEWGNLTQRNGTIYGNSLTEYLSNCGRYCFWDVWIAQFNQGVENDECLADWNSGDVPKRFDLSKN